MKQRILSVAMALCLLVSCQSTAHAWSEEASSPQEDVLTEESLSEPIAQDSVVPSPTEVYEAMIALQDQDAYKEGTVWTNDEPYSDLAGYYYWNGGPLNGVNIVAVGCVAFAFVLSDAAFGSLQARIYASGGFSYEDIKVGDILQVNNDTHTVIVLEVSDAGVVVAEGNYNGQVHWGRAISRKDVMSSVSHYITRYPEGYVSPDDPAANDIIGSGTLDGGLGWELTRAGTLTISGSGAMPDFSSTGEQPWNSFSSQIRKVIIGNGVTSIGSCAFWDCGVLSAEIPSGVTTIGNSAFRGSSIISVTIPSSVTTVGESSFRGCESLSSIAVSQGVETIGQNAFYGCTSLTSIALPSSIGEVGAAAFFQCTQMKSATFAAGSKQVKLGDNLFTGCYYLMSVTLPQSIDRIGEGMFQNCMLLAGVEIPQGADSIGASAFASCSSLSVVLIPDSVTTIGIAAFAACPLSDIYFTGTEAQWNSIGKIGDTASVVSKATIHYEYAPASTPSPEEPTQSPDQTPLPEEPTQSPDQTPSPEEPTQSPDQTPSPEPTRQPDQTPSPEEPTQSPDQTPSPEPTRQPDQTPSPEPAMSPEPTSTPDTRVPFIDGGSAGKGWEAIKEEAANTSEGELRVNMNGALVVPGDVLDSVRGQNLTISFDMGNGIIWSVNGRNVTADRLSNVDLSVQVGTSAIPQNIVDSVAGDRRTTQLRLAHSGDFGYSAVLRIDMGSANAGLYATLFHYNESAGGLEYVTADRIDEDGIAELTFTHASDYVIVLGDDVVDKGSGETSSDSDDEPAVADSHSSKEAEVWSPKTGEDFNAVELLFEGSRLNIVWLLLTGTMGMTVAGIIICLIQKKVNKVNRRDISESRGTKSDHPVG